MRDKENNSTAIEVLKASDIVNLEKIDFDERPKESYLAITESVKGFKNLAEAAPMINMLAKNQRATWIFTAATVYSATNSQSAKVRAAAIEELKNELAYEKSQLYNFRKAGELLKGEKFEKPLPNSVNEYLAWFNKPKKAADYFLNEVSKIGEVNFETENERKETVSVSYAYYLANKVKGDKVQKVFFYSGDFHLQGQKIKAENSDETKSGITINVTSFKTEIKEKTKDGKDQHIEIEVDVNFTTIK